MTDVKAHTPSDAARSPSHPDHARWVKERTLAMEVSHQNQIGGSLREAEKVNMVALRRLEEQKRRDARKPKQPEKTQSEINEGVAARAAKRELEVKADTPYRGARVPGAHCGQCLKYKRELRITAIMAKAREADGFCEWLTWQLVALGFALQKRIDCNIAPTRRAPKKAVAFSQMTKQQRIKAYLGAVTEICDWSIPKLGAWR